MPTYDYKCDHCEHIFEERQKITDAPLVNCAKCGHNSLKRGVGGGSATFRFLGEGFYITDYKKECSPAGKCPCEKKD